ncbi:MAG TPA: dynamin family protein [Actinomycetaceae bacterium]|nr:dynamin family protein [Actinomycetaceae bacterium]
MSRDVKLEVLDLLDSARTLYGVHAPGTLTELERKMQEPLRLAIAGIVKSGKSTLLNAFLGERVAATDAGECTRLVTWYRYEATPSVTLYRHDGSRRQLPIERADGKLTFEPDIPTNEIDRIEVGWPARALQSVILIDTPGIASLSLDSSARSTGFLAPEDSHPSADAIVYLMRHLHPSDLRFLESFRDTAAGTSRTVNAVAVLSRADEVGSGRIDSLLSARKVAHRYERDDSLASLVLGVFPVAGLLAEGARTLSEREFAAFRELAALPHEDREKVLVSADRFIRLSDFTTLAEEERRELISRFGIFGLRLATSLIRTGATNASLLSEQMVRQSGLIEFGNFVQDQFVGRAATLKAHGVLESLERLLLTRPVENPAPLFAGIERIRLGLHELRELSLLSLARTAGLPVRLSEAGAIRIVGGEGLAAHRRLGLPEGSSRHALETRVSDELASWRARVHDPANDRAATEVCHVVIRSLEGAGSQFRSGGGDDRAPLDVMLASGPRDGTRERAHEHGEDRQTGLGAQQLL